MKNKQKIIKYLSLVLLIIVLIKLSTSKLDFVPRPEPVSTPYLKYSDNAHPSLFTGAMTYYYPIQTPPGVNGQVPQIGLSYSHYGAKSLPGVVGVSWDITNNFIRRDTNYSRSNTSDDYFVISLNGISEKLVYVPAEGRYHTEHESFLFIQNYSNGTNANKRYWIVKTTDGTQYRFGFNNNSEQVSNLETYTVAWYLDEISDTSSNKIYYTYQESPGRDTGNTVLSNVSYGVSEILFIYDDTKYFPFMSYSGGTYVNQSSLISDILVRYNSTQITRYNLDYMITNNRPYLSEIIQYGRDNQSALPSTEFYYSAFASGFMENSTYALPSNAAFGTTADQGTRLLDIDGDGVEDIVKFRLNEQAKWINNLKGYNAQQNFTNLLPYGVVDGNGSDLGVRFADINGDGRVDIVQALSGTFNLTLLKYNNGTGWVNATYNLPAGISFIVNTSTNCTPTYPVTWDCGSQISCNTTHCVSNCTRYTCNETLPAYVHNYTVPDPMWNQGTGKYQYGAITNGYTPQDQKCYRFAYRGSTDTDTDMSPCYDMYDTVELDCSKDLDAFAGVGFTTGSSSSWLTTVPRVSQYVGWNGEYPSSYWSNKYFRVIGMDNEPDNYPDDGDWDSLDNALCDEGGTYDIYCAPSSASCNMWGKTYCGYGCSGQTTNATVVMGVYIDSSQSSMTPLSAFNDNKQCHTDKVTSNRYEGHGLYQVTAYNTYLERTSFNCTKSIEYRDQGVRLVDLNGDGRTDIVKAISSSIIVWINTPSGFIPDNSWSIPSETYFVTDEGRDRGVRIVDVNGDGLPDILRADTDNRSTWLNTGKGWANSSLYIVPQEVVFVNNLVSQGVTFSDFNSDGMVDLIKAKDGVTQVWLNNGYEWFLSESTLPSGARLDDYSFQLADVNGDTLPDVVESNESVKMTWIQGSETPFLLTKIKNPLGGNLTIGYSPISSLDNTGNDTIPDLGMGGHVVTSISMDNGLGTVTQTSYNYSNGMYDPVSKEYRGFANADEVRADGSKIRHYFYQDDSRKGQEYQTDILSSQGIILKRSENVYKVTSQNNYYIVLLNNSYESTYNAQGQSPQTIGVSYYYNAYGNYDHISYLGDTAVTGDGRYIYYQYANNTDKWIVNRPYRIEMQNSTYDKVRETKLSYDGNSYGSTPTKGLLTNRELWLSSGIGPFSSNSYNSYGNLVSSTDPLGRVSNYTYDPSNVFVSSTRNPLGHIARTEYDQGTGNVLFTIDSNGIKTNFTYDTFGRKTGEILPYDSLAYPTSVITYDFNGVPPGLVKISKRVNTSTGNTYDEYYYYDGEGKIVQYKKEDVSGSFVTMDYVYDNKGQLSFETNPYFSDSSAFTARNASVPGRNYTYDALGRIINVRNSDGTMKQLNYSYYDIDTYDENNNRKHYSLDVYGRVISVTEYNEGETYVTEYDYDSTDNLLQITDSLSNVISFAYDTLGRKTRLDDPDLGTWTYEYDSAGNLVRQTDGNDESIVLTYDALNRVTKKNASNEVITYTYDQVKNGTLSKVTTSYGDKTLGYDDRLRVVSENQTMFGNTFRTSYTYDSMNRLLTKTEPNNIVVSYSYSDNTLLKSINGVLTDIQYNELGLPRVRTYASGLVTNMYYNSSNLRLNRIQTGSLQDMTYGYDPVGNVLKITDFAHNRLYSMDYDQLDRLTNAVLTENSMPLWSFEYTYDPIGNIMSITSHNSTMTYSYGSKPVHAPSAIDRT